MLEMRPICENCGKNLPNESNEAMICTFESTFCQTCVDDLLNNVCPNCGGGFEKRPTRPTAALVKNPIVLKPYLKKVDSEIFIPMLEKLKDINPRER
jgi:hypothetical protein